MKKVFFLGVTFILSLCLLCDLPYAQEALWADEIRDLKTQAQEGNITAQFRLGLMFSQAQGVRQSFEAAHKWFRMAASGGHPQAEFQLGLLYAKGEGVEQDYIMARSWYMKANAGGNLIAANKLGLMYLLGQGVDQDDKVAINWWLHAATRGHVLSQYNLGSMYEQGRGVQKDFIEAYAWYNIAASENYRRAQRARKLVSKKLSPEDLKKAVARSQEYYEMYVVPFIKIEKPAVRRQKSE
ncbi:sel1 repeat family protein [bacterium]|mgnify:CR=1 FL=1|nr:sel1 repeat family protein [bacterium]